MPAPTFSTATDLLATLIEVDPTAAPLTSA